MLRVEKKVVIICLIVGFIGVISTALGFAAEAKRLKVSQANTLVFASEVSLSLAQIVITVASACIQCRRGPFTSMIDWTTGVVCGTASILTLVGVLLLHLGGWTLLKQQNNEQGVVKPGVYAIAAILGFASVAINILHCITISAGKNPFEGLVTRNHRAQVPSIIICLVGFLGLISTSLGFAAEAKRLTVSQVKEISRGICSHPRSPAYDLGITGAVCLVLAQIVINSTTACILCIRDCFPSATHWILGRVCFLVNWSTFTFAFLVFLWGAVLNDEHAHYYCDVVKPGVFAAAAISGFVSVAMGILHCVTISAAKSPVVGLLAQNHSNIAMGQGQDQAQAQAQEQAQVQVPPSVSVQEDTFP